MAAPENWEALCPFAEKLLDEQIAATNDENLISSYRVKLQTLFAAQAEYSLKLKEKSAGLFATLQTENPYQESIDKLALIYATDLTTGNDIEMLLHALKEHLGYQAFDSGIAEPADVDDLANRLRDAERVRLFVSEETTLRVGYAYARVTLPAGKAFSALRTIQQAVQSKLTNLTPYIDSPVRLKTELIGSRNPDASEKNTIGRLKAEYLSLYATVHHHVIDAVSEAKEKILQLISGDDFQSLTILEGITALQPAVSIGLKEQFAILTAGLFDCPTPSQESIEGQLTYRPSHECGLSFELAERYIQEAKTAETDAQHQLDAAIEKKLSVLLNPAIRERLQQGVSEPIIAEMLACRDQAALRTILLPASRKDSGIVKTINRYLKKILVKPVKLSAFIPSATTIERGQVGKIVAEFQGFIEGQLTTEDPDALPVLQIER